MIPPLAEMIEQALQRHAADPAIRFKGVWYDWGWVRAVGERVIALLDAAGVREDEAVAIAPATDPASAAALLGLLMRSREVVMMYAYQSPAALARKVAELNCAGVVALDRLWEPPMIDAARDTGAVGITISLDGQALAPGTKLDRSVKHRLAPPDRGLNLLSSGTTGPPKLRHMDYTLVRRAMVLESMVQAYGAAPAPYPALHTSAFGNIAGLYAWLPFVMSGRKVVMLEKFVFDDWLDYMREFRPSGSGLPPSAYRELLERDVPVELFEQVAYMGGGASRLDPELQRAVEEKYSFKVLQSYGATEFGGVVSAVTPEHLAEFGVEKGLSVGRPLAGVGAEFRIVDPDSGVVMSAGGTGVLHAKIPRIGPDWIATSDLARLDEDGFLYYVGRNDGVIVRGGFKVDPEQVRTALLAHPALYDAIVVGRPDPRLGEVPVAAFAVREGHAAPGAAALEAHLRERLPATFLPAAYRQVERIPVTATSKPDIAAARLLFTD